MSVAMVDIEPRLCLLMNMLLHFICLALEVHSSLQASKQRSENELDFPHNMTEFLNVMNATVKINSINLKPSVGGPLQQPISALGFPAKLLTAKMTACDESIRFYVAEVSIENQEHFAITPHDK